VYLKNSVNGRRALSRSAAFKYRNNDNRHFQKSENSIRGNEDNKSQFKERMHEKLDLLNDEDADRVSRQIDEIIKISDVQHSEVEQLNGDHQADSEFDRDEADEEAQELNDKVSDLPEPVDDNRSISTLSEMGSSRKDVRSRSSRKTSKSYISKLRHELENERSQRMMLESEIEELKKVTSQISSRLGLTPQKILA
jgi:hypothetical protein